MTATRTPMVPVIYGDRCHGFVFKRRDSFEAFDIDERSLGLFADEHAAAAAIFNQQARGEQ